jgi:hypothetical protein
MSCLFFSIHMFADFSSYTVAVRVFQTIYDAVRTFQTIYDVRVSGYAVPLSHFCCNIHSPTTYMHNTIGNHGFGFPHE